MSLDELAPLAERLGELGSWQERFAWTDRWPAGRWGAQVDREVTWAWHRISASRGTVRVEDLAAELGWSRTRRWTRFRSRIGLPPKRAAKLVRFDHAVHGLVAGQAAAGVAADTGYAGQSHLHRDVTEYTGVTPATVVDEPFLAVDDVARGW
ncbi:helix-turn-helix domain-containing protein [Actinophytocola sp. KF-1]